MALVHRVIILNKPLKIRGYTPFQWVLLVLSAGLGFAVFSYIPKEWKLGNLPVGILLGIIIVCAAMVFVGMSQLKPLVWWKCLILWRTGQMSTLFLPHSEPGSVYPDPTVTELSPREDQNYVS